MSNNTSTVGKFDKLIPWYFVAFFIGLAAIDGTFMYIATNTHTGVIDKNYYETGLKYNKIIEAERKQNKLGWIVDVNLEDSRTLKISLNDKNGNFIDNANIEAKIIRPTSSGHDFTAKLKAIDNKYYATNIKFPLKGVWDIEININKNDNLYKKIKRVVVNN